ncbi:MAG: hypothetical protein IBJ15_09900 [Alphaproteobacteria bacterium]|nr:hypothetical protein [Alphaproteobacteria bacterium]
MADLIRNDLSESGFEIVRGFVGPQSIRSALSLVEGLRNVVRRSRFLDAQRVQPLRRHLGDEKLTALADAVSFDRLREIFEARIGPGVEIDPYLLGLWIEPARRTYVLPWHRDLRDNSKGLDWKAWYRQMANPRFFNQFHIALLPDECLWVVPGSHLRDDTDFERRTFPSRPILVDFIERDLDPWYDGSDKFPARFSRRWAEDIFDKAYYAKFGLPLRPGARRRNADVYARALDYCRAMPDALQVKLQPGDLLIYRNSIWHTAIYRADVTRATLFSHASTPESLAWLDAQRQSIAKQGPAARWFSRDQLT